MRPISPSGVVAPSSAQTPLGGGRSFMSASSSSTGPREASTVFAASNLGAPPFSIRDNRARSRYELRIDGEPTGWLDYRHARKTMIVAHTEIHADHRGKGLGPLLVRRALEDARHAGKTVIPTCPFAIGYIARHPELDEYLAPGLRRRR
jgi:uncharacterized protein